MKTKQKTSAQVPSWMPLWQVKHDDDSSVPLQWRKQEDVPFRVAECARKCAKVPSKVPFRWRKHDAVP